MPVAIRMANGAIYYPEGFLHAANDNRLSKEDQYRQYMLSIGYVENPYQNYVWKNQKFVRKDRLPELEKAYQNALSEAKSTFKKGKSEWDRNQAIKGLKKNVSNAANAVGNAVGTATKPVSEALKSEGAHIAAGYGRGTYRYDREHGEKGNAVGRTLAGVGGAVGNTAVGRGVRNEARNISAGYKEGGVGGALKATSAYKVGRTAVGKAADLISTGAGKAWSGIKGAGQFVGGKAVDAGKFVADKAVKAGGKIAELARGAADKVANSAVGKGVSNAASTAATDFKNVAKAIGDTAVGKAALKAGKAALDAGGSVLQTVGGALLGIAKFFGGAAGKAWGGIKTAGQFVGGKAADAAGAVANTASNAADWVGNKFKKKEEK